MQTITGQYGINNNSCGIVIVPYYYEKLAKRNNLHIIDFLNYDVAKQYLCLNDRAKLLAFNKTDHFILSKILTENNLNKIWSKIKNDKPNLSNTEDVSTNINILRDLYPLVENKELFKKFNSDIIKDITFDNNIEIKELKPYEIFVNKDAVIIIALYQGFINYINSLDTLLIFLKDLVQIILQYNQTISNVPYRIYNAYIETLIKSLI